MVFTYLCIFVVVSVVCWLIILNWHSAEPDRTGNLHLLQANDLHGIHDLLMVGYAGIWISDSGKKEIQKSVCGIAKMLPSIHPVAECRSTFQKILDQDQEDCKQIVIRMADASWQCLPARFSGEDYSAVFTPEALADKDLQKVADNPELVPQSRSMLGACAETSWDRTCSYWVALHAMSLRAEQQGTGKEFLENAITAISSGATQCKGCQRHFRVLHEPLLKRWHLWDTELNDTELSSQY